VTRAAFLVAALAACGHRDAASTAGSGSAVAVIVPVPVPVPVAVAVDAAPAAVVVDAAPAEPPHARAASEAEAEAQKFADLLGSEPPRPTEADMARRRPGADLDSQTADVREVPARGPGELRFGGASRPRAGGGTAGDAGPSGKVTAGIATQNSATRLSGKTVVAKINSAYKPGLQRCYRAALRENPKRYTVVTLVFAIDELGRTRGGTANGADGDLEDCIEAQMAGWRFPVPKDSDGEAAEASFLLPLTLQPE